jgi:hypothetical protein
VAQHERRRGIQGRTFHHQHDELLYGEWRPHHYALHEGLNEVVECLSEHGVKIHQEAEPPIANRENAWIVTGKDHK